MFIVATNVIASWPPERRPTGTPHTRANLDIAMTPPSLGTKYFNALAVFTHGCLPS